MYTDYSAIGPNIMGGGNASPQEFPFQVGLTLISNGFFLCGGSIITPLVIVTAAHCLVNRTNSTVKVTAGDYDRFVAEGNEQHRMASRFVIHESYNKTVHTNDIALIFLSSPFNLTEYVAIIDYPKTATTFSGAAEVSGWGQLSVSTGSHNILQKATVNILTKCVYNKYMLDSEFCAGGYTPAACKGDSGSPLSGFIGGSSTRQLFGILSRGPPCTKDKRGPEIYTNVSKHVAWILKHLGCEPGQFRCSSGKCIARSWKCDGDQDCPAGDDESDCHASTTTTQIPQGGCGLGQFRCSCGKCIARSWKCDGDKDCPAGEDEIDCHASTTTTQIPQVLGCGLGQFRCSSGKCIARSWKCDGDQDCPAGDDESDCHASTTTTQIPQGGCGLGQFRCSCGKCIARSWKCDGDKDCPAGEDEVDCHASTIHLPLSTAQIPQDILPRVQLYSDKNFKGDSLPIIVDGCLDLPNNWINRASSINTAGRCARVWYTSNCQSLSIEIMPGSPSHNDLSLIVVVEGRGTTWNNNIMSISKCNGTVAPAIATTPATINIDPDSDSDEDYDWLIDSSK